MRQATNQFRVMELMNALGNSVKGTGRIYFAGGVSAVLLGWREMPMAVDFKADPEPAGFFEALPRLKNSLNLNIEPACPSDFIPPLPAWKDRSQFITKKGDLEFFHYDFYSQALSKIERGHGKDKIDLSSMLAQGLIVPARLWELFESIRPGLVRYPALDPQTFENKVQQFCGTNP